MNNDYIVYCSVNILLIINFENKSFKIKQKWPLKTGRVRVIYNTGFFFDVATLLSIYRIFQKNSFFRELFRLPIDWYHLYTILFFHENKRFCCQLSTKTQSRKSVGHILVIFSGNTLSCDLAIYMSFFPG